MGCVRRLDNLSSLLAQRAASEGWGGSGQVPFVLAERAR